MILKNKLNLTDQIELARAEEKPESVTSYSKKCDLFI